MAAPNSTFNRILSTTLYNYLTSGELADNIFNGLRLWDVLQKRGAKQTEDGGERIVIPLEYAKNSTARWMDEYDALDLTQQDTITSAEFLWKLLAGVVLVTEVEERKNSGKHQIINLAKAKVKNLVHSMQDLFNQALFSDGTTVTQPLGLEAIVATTGTYGGISRSAQTWWQANVTAVGGALTGAAMSAMYNTASHNRWNPDIICTTKLQYEKYEALCQAVQRINMPAIGDISFDHLNFRGTGVIWDHYNPVGVMYFLTTEFLKIIEDSKDAFTLKPTQQHPFQLMTIHPCIWFGAICCNNPRTQGKLTGLT